MRTAYDFSPLFRSSVGFDRIFDLLENATRVQALDNWPPYNIEKAGEDQYRISMAVAGFSPDELNLTSQPNWLVVSGQKQGEESTQYLHRGIATRSFERRFELADHVKVKDARLDNGLLTIELVREVPEEMRPRRIEVQAWNALGAGEQPQQIEHQKAAGAAGRASRAIWLGGLASGATPAPVGCTRDTVAVTDRMTSVTTASGNCSGRAANPLICRRPHRRGSKPRVTVLPIGLSRFAAVVV
jgi:molecular chaperone IbpA